MKIVLDWASAIWTVVGWLGLAAIVSGVLASIGGAIWAVITGVDDTVIARAALQAFAQKHGYDPHFLKDNAV